LISAINKTLFRIRNLYKCKLFVLPVCCSSELKGDTIWHQTCKFD